MHFPLKKCFKRITSKIIILTFFALILGCAANKPKSFPEFDFNKDEKVKNSNTYNINNMFKDIMLLEKKADDYYFVILGDSRNMVRSDDLSGFNYVAKHIIYAKDKNNEDYIYDKIKFVVHMGDIVYEGAVKHQWDNLKKAFSKKDYFGDNYPYIKLLVKDKPIFPVLGNHEIMKFRFKKETPYMNLASLNVGVKYFKEFFDWDSFVLNPNILYAIPAKLKKETFLHLCNKLEKEDIKKMTKHYMLLEDNFYHLRIFQDLINQLEKKEILSKSFQNFLVPERKEAITEDLYKIFSKLGYNTLPVLSSDNLICYAFEINNHIYLFMDSMSRGWQYNVFSKLKKSVYHQKSDQHNLNLFTKSDLNGQYEFYRAVTDYAKSKGKKVVPFMHHSPFNSVNDIDGSGIEYNLKLMLGVEYQKENDIVTFKKNICDHTFFDDLIFSNLNDTGANKFIDNIFTSCVHYYERFTLDINKNSQVQDKINWYITGGGGGELETKYDNEKLKYTQMLYNKRLTNTYNYTNKSGNSNLLNTSIKITNNEIKKKFNFLVVHVKDEKIVDVSPHFIDEKDVRLKKPLIRLSAKLESPVFYAPISSGNLAMLGIGSWGLEKVIPMLSAFTWDPSFGIGYLNYNINGENNDIVSLEQFDPLKFTFHFSNTREISLSFLGLTAMLGGGDISRAYLSFGLEGPLLYNYFSHHREPIPTIMKKFSFGFKYHTPLPVGDKYDPDFGKDVAWSWVIKFSLF